MNEQFIRALNDWCSDHYKHFKCLPMEFEWNDKVYKFEEFIRYVNAETVTGKYQKELNV